MYSIRTTKMKRHLRYLSLMLLILTVLPMSFAGLTQSRAYAVDTSMGQTPTPSSGHVLQATTGPSGGTATQTPPAATTNSCGFEGALAWVFCPVSEGLRQLINAMNAILKNMLFVDTSNIFTSGFKTAWSTFRNIGIALLVIVGLVMVISQALGLELLDAYTIRKVLPRLFVAAFGMAASWPILQVLVTLFNDLGVGAHDLILAPFDGIGYPKGLTGGGLLNMIVEKAVGGAAAVGAAAAAFIGWNTLGALGIVSLLFTIVLAVLIGVLVLGLRQVIIVAAILLAPFAIAAYVLPGTQKIWKFWKDTLITSLVMFPIIMAFLATGEALARIFAQTSIQNTSVGQTFSLMAMLVLIAPYFMIPFSFKLAGGLMSTIFSLANDKSRGLFDRARNYRTEARKRRMGKWADGTLGRPGSMTQTLMGNYARATTIPETNLLTRRGRQKFARESKNLIDGAADERAQKGPQAVSGDSDGNLIGMQAHSRQEYSAMYRAHRRLNGDTRNDDVIDAEAEEKMAKLEGVYQGQVGSRAFRRSATNAHVALDNAAWDGIVGERLVGESALDYYARQNAAKEQVIHSLGQDGVFEADEFAALERTNKYRGDNIKGSFGQHADYIDKVMKGAAAGTAADMLGAESNMVKEVNASMAAGGNRRAVERIAANLSKRLALSRLGDNTALGAYVTGDAATGSTSTTQNLVGDGGVDTWAAEYAQAANIHEAQNQSGLGNTEYYATMWKETAFTEADLPSMTPDIQREAVKLLSAVRLANEGRAQGDKLTVTHQDVKNFLQGNQVGFSDAAGSVHVAQSASVEAIKSFTARKKEWGSGIQAQQAGAQGGAPTTPGGGPVVTPLGGAPGGTLGSDIRLKQNIHYIKTTASGIRLYRFNYIWGGPTYVGVLAQEILRIAPEAVGVDANGFYNVDYAQLGLRMTTFYEWQKSQPLRQMTHSNSGSSDYL